MIRRLVPGTNQETYTIQEKEKQHIQQRLEEEENCQTPKKQETQQDNTVSHFVDKYKEIFFPQSIADISQGVKL